MRMSIYLFIYICVYIYLIIYIYIQYTCVCVHIIQYTELRGGAAARVAAAGPQRAVVWQAQYTEAPGGAAVDPNPRWSIRNYPVILQ